MLSNGVPMLAALEIAGDTIGNRAYRRGLSHLGDAIKAGRRLSDELGHARVFPRLGKSLVRVGEESGRLEEMLQKTAEIYDQETRRSIQRGLALLTPTLTILLGLLIAGIIFSILLAILSINDVAL
jgi:general secretion pathway protein F